MNWSFARLFELFGSQSGQGKTPAQSQSPAPEVPPVESDENWWETDPWLIVGVTPNPEDPGHRSGPPVLRLTCRRDPDADEGHDDYADVYVSQSMLDSLGPEAANLKKGDWIEVKGQMFGPLLPDVWAEEIKARTDIPARPDAPEQTNIMDILLGRFDEAFDEPTEPGFRPVGP